MTSESGVRMCLAELHPLHVRSHGYPSVEAFKKAFGLDSYAAPAERKRVSNFFKNRPCPHQRGLKRTTESRARMSAAAIARVLRNPVPTCMSGPPTSDGLCGCWRSTLMCWTWNWSPSASSPTSSVWNGTWCCSKQRRFIKWVTGLQWKQFSNAIITKAVVFFIATTR